MRTILVVDDEPNYLVILEELLAEEGFEILTADNGASALEIAGEVDLDLILTDMQMPGISGLEVLETIKASNKDLPVIMITAYGEVEKAVAAMQAGAFNYLTKPFKNEELIANVHKAIEHYSLCRENKRLRAAIKSRHSFADMIGKNNKMQELYRLIEKVAPTPSSVLISGESGTGKELVARAVHLYSPRESQPFISVNCAALPANLLESELFGHEKGAFTGATTLRKGRFELADNGTLFLDEIGELDLALQSKLLRIIQERTFERIGASSSLEVDVRIIAATNKNLKKEADRGLFRDDLFYRLNVLSLHLPPLRDRLDDIPLLVNHFLAKFGELIDKPDLKISAEAIDILMEMPWEGNIRELENTIERASILCSNKTIESKDVLTDSQGEKIPLAPKATSAEGPLVRPGSTLPDTLYSLEKQALKEALNENDNIQARAAKRLGITKSLLQYKLKKFGIKLPSRSSVDENQSG